jgi:hypothetical protein
MFKTILLATAASLTFGAAPALAQNAAPITIAACGMTPGAQVDDEAGAPRLPGSLLISFANLSDMAADSVTFDVEQNGQHVLITDSGLFAPGATINHRFAGSSAEADGAALSTPASCSVVAVHFADGQSWGH